ncbi:MAG: hypothetical protein A2V77_17520 [Anaeromyxobacter sp. RBG_16_69_14]|nr:MAG: hypothetical protein A2V77_17520 [Anaeromyxobacter sp. RBG_16_69_14]
MVVAGESDGQPLPGWLQPGIDLLQRVPDFPADGPLLIITDGYCDRLQVKREHAFLVPRGRSLPFAPRGPVFRIS